MSSMRITVRLDHTLHRKLGRAASEAGQSESDIVRQAIAEHLEKRGQRESCLELARRAGIVGAARGLPRDLSANPAHFEGFGQ